MASRLGPDRAAALKLVLAMIAVMWIAESIDVVAAGNPLDEYGIHPRDAAGEERHRRAVERVVQACRNTGKIPGFAADGHDDALRRAGQGFLYLTAGSDIGFMLDGARAGIKTLGLA